MTCIVLCLQSWFTFQTAVEGRAMQTSEAWSNNAVIVAATKCTSRKEMPDALTLDEVDPCSQTMTRSSGWRLWTMNSFLCFAQQTTLCTGFLGSFLAETLVNPAPTTVFPISPLHPQPWHL
mmetsp:Transcript_122292/g.228467  ORF Transcript_122292/g.228467 Transcript_122292/m.228467 type:complete len:121 (-) Transcript_122292:1654-2016(-)